MRTCSRIIPVLLSLFILHGCSNNASESTPSKDTLDTLSAKEPDSNAVHVFTLPAPLQVATLMKLEKEPYNSQHLQTGVPNTNFANNYSLALNLGIYVVDVGYASMYDQRQTALNYAKAVQGMTTELGIGSSVNKKMAERFEANIKNNDSLCVIILESFQDAHNYCRENEREDAGLFILCGSYIEGLHLMLQSKQALGNMQLRNFIGQQKIFLDNIHALSGYIPESNYMSEMEGVLDELHKGFEGITVKAEETKEGSVAVNCNISYLQLKKLQETVSKVRSRIKAA
jgi:hypothetical protein